MATYPTNLLTPNTPPITWRSQVVWPSAPPSLPAAVTGLITGGPATVRNYYIKLTWIIQTQDGTNYESLPGLETAISVPSGDLLTVTNPTVPSMPYAVTGFAVYVGTSSGGETQQATLTIGQTWTEPVGGISAGTALPTSWGNSLIFTYPARQFPFANQKRVGHDDLSTAGVQQSITWYVDNLLDFEVPYIASGTEATAWQTFLAAAVQRVPFDFYQDSTLNSLITLLLTSDNPKVAYKAPGLYTTRMPCRQVVLG